MLQQQTAGSSINISSLNERVNWGGFRCFNPNSALISPCLIKSVQTHFVRKSDVRIPVKKKHFSDVLTTNEAEEEQNTKGQRNESIQPRQEDRIKRFLTDLLCVNVVINVFISCSETVGLFQSSSCWMFNLQNVFRVRFLRVLNPDSHHWVQEVQQVPTASAQRTRTAEMIRYAEI